MPKQSGIHQIKGKLGTVSYYGRKYSNTGFLRSINQEVGERVKTAENYAGTREQNEYFKRAAGAAWCVLNGMKHREYYFTRNDLNGRLQKFLREEYAKYAFEGDSEIRKIRWRSSLLNLLMSLQKNRVNYFLGIDVQGGYNTGNNASTSENKIQIELKLVGDSYIFTSLYPDIDVQESRVEYSVFGVDSRGGNVQQIQNFEIGSLESLFDAGAALDYVKESSIFVPHVSYETEDTGLFVLVGLVPNIGGVDYISRAAFTILEIPLNEDIVLWQ